MAGQPIAKEGDEVTGLDTHYVLMPTGPAAAPTPTLMALPFKGTFASGLSSSVFVDNRGVALEVESVAENNPKHVAPRLGFVRQPSNRASVPKGSACVFVGGRGVVRSGDAAITCGDPDALTGAVMAQGVVFVGS